MAWHLLLFPVPVGAPVPSLLKPLPSGTGFQAEALALGRGLVGRGERDAHKRNPSLPSWAGVSAGHRACVPEAVPIPPLTTTKNSPFGSSKPFCPRQGSICTWLQVSEQAEEELGWVYDRAGWGAPEAAELAPFGGPLLGLPSPCGPCPHCTQASRREVSPEPASRRQPGAPDLRGAFRWGWWQCLLPGRTPGLALVRALCPQSPRDSQSGLPQSRLANHTPSL